MTGKKVATCGLIYVAPENSVVVSSANFGKSQSSETQISSKTEYKDYGGGYSTKFTKTEKSGGFIDGRNGNLGYKEEVDYKSSVKISDNDLGCTTRYETQVKHKKVTTYSNPKKSSGAIKDSFTSPNMGSGGVKFKSVTTYSNPNKSYGGSGSRYYGGRKNANYSPY